MTKPILNQCCFCATLETGGYIIGWLYTIFGFLGAIAFIGLAVLYGQSTDPVIVEVKTAIVVILIVAACFAIVNIGAGILLILGVKHKNHRKMILILVLMILGIVSSFMNFINSAAASDIISVLIGVCFQIYFFICILSLYFKIKNESSFQQNGQRAYA